MRRVAGEVGHGTTAADRLQTCRRGGEREPDAAAAETAVVTRHTASGIDCPFAHCVQLPLPLQSKIQIRRCLPPPATRYSTECERLRASDRSGIAFLSSTDGRSTPHPQPRRRELITFTDDR